LWTAVARIRRHYIIAILISGFVSVTLTPMLCARVLKNEQQSAHGLVYRWNEAAFTWMQDVYDRSLQWSLAHRPAILGLFAASVLASIGLFSVMQQDFLPSDDTGQAQWQRADPDRHLLRPGGGLYAACDEGGGGRSQCRRCAGR